jgi:hypothetical protein
MLLISKTYERVTEESAEDGEAAETGFIFCDELMTFSELVRELRDYCHASSWPLRGTRYDWVNTEAEQDYATGDWTIYGLHFSHSNPQRREKYWRKALQRAGLIRAA